jgi:hypothetical protein
MHQSHLAPGHAVSGMRCCDLAAKLQCGWDTHMSRTLRSLRTLPGILLLLGGAETVSRLAVSWGPEGWRSLRWEAALLAGAGASRNHVGS